MTNQTIGSSQIWGDEALKINRMGNGNLVAVIGTSLVQHNHVATAAKISTWGRGWLGWANFFSKGRINTPVWNDPAVYVGWEPSGVGGATRYYRGLNAGVSGQTYTQILARKSFLIDNVDCDFIIVDCGTNDMGSQTKEDIQAARETLANYYLDNGKVVFLLPILARGIGSWASGSDERKKANWINAKTKAFNDKTRKCFELDWNQQWVDSANADGEPIAGYDCDNIHFNPKGGVAVGEVIANFFADFLPPPSPRVWSQDDLYDATNNPRGNVLANPFLTGTAGALTGAGMTGSVATGMRMELSTGNATAVASKVTTTNNRGDQQVITITPSTTASLIYFRTTAADTTHTLASTWVQASCEVDIGSFNAWEGVSLCLIDQNGTSGLTAYAMEPYTSVAADDAGAGV